MPRLTDNLTGSGYDMRLPAKQISGPGAPIVVFEGDSRTAQSKDAGQGYTCYGPVSWVRALARMRMTAITLAVAGNTSADMKARRGQVQGLRPWAVVRWCGVNDIAAAVPGATAAQNIIDCALSDIAGGTQYVVLILETGYNAWAAPTVAQMVALNKALLAFAQTNSRVRIINSLEMVVDYTAATQVPITYLAGVFGDGLTHPSVALSYRLGARIAALLDSLWVPPDAGTFLMPGDATNLLANAGFQATGAGGYSAGWSGTTVNSWFGFQDGLATVVMTPQATQVQLVITTTGPAAVLLFQDPVAGAVAGDYLVGSSEIEITGTPVNLIQAQANFYALIGGVTSFAWPLFWTAGYDPASPSSSWPQVPMVQRSPETTPLAIGAGTQTNLRYGLNVSFRGAGSATIKFRKPNVRKVPAGYLS